MTRKDYILIAQAFREARAKIADVEPKKYQPELQDGVSYVADYLADALKENPAFDSARFLQACGNYSEERKNDPSR